MSAFHPKRTLDVVIPDKLGRYHYTPRARPGVPPSIVNVRFSPIADIRWGAMTWPMPVAKPPLAPVAPAPLTAEEAEFITQTVRRFYGNNAVARNYGADPAQLQLHVETELDPGMEKYDCIGVLMTRIERPISMEVTKRGRPVRSNAKIAYRQGVIL